LNLSCGRAWDRRQDFQVAWNLVIGKFAFAEGPQFSVRDLLVRICLDKGEANLV
jgi:hypothetical protein